jgi:hypothetical protein
MDDSLKGQVIDAIEEPHTRELSHRHTSCLGATARDLLGHLLDCCGNVSAADLENDKIKMDAPIDASQPIVIHCKRIDDGLQCTTDGYAPHSPAQISQRGCHAVSESGHDNDACKLGARNQHSRKHGHSSKHTLQRNVMI